MPVNFETYDFTTLYTTLDLTDLKQRLGVLVDRLYDRRRSTPNLQVTAKRQEAGKWLTNAQARKIKPTATTRVVQANQLKEWIQFLVDNTFIGFAGQVYRQKVGIPMGTNCAGLLANLYLYTFELDFMENLIRANDLAKVELFMNTCRYIDDVCAMGNDFFSTHLYKDANQIGIYPKDSLTLKRTCSGTSCNYLDLHIFHNRTGWHTRIYDKRLEPQFRMINFIRFPDIDSAISDSAKYGVVISQLHRFSRLCSYRSDFIKEVVSLLYTLVKKGYNRRVMFRQVKAFLLRRPQLYVSFSSRKLYKQIAVSLIYREMFGN